jgi:chromosome segregation ATPase
VQQKVEDNEAEILIAYKNHLVKIRKEMEEFKNETLAAANSSVSHEQKIEQLEKQLIIFRDESLRLFEKIVAKDNMIEELQAKVEELTVENRHLCDSYKLMSRRNRELEMIKYKLNLKTEKETLGE